MKITMSSARSWFPWFIFVLLSVTWGSSFILIKRGLEAFTASELGGLRIVIAWLFLLPFSFSRLKKYPLRTWLLFLAVGAVGSLIPAFLFAAAEEGIDSSLAGILNSLTPLFTLLIGISFFGIRPKWYNIAGVFIGLTGAIGLVSVSGTQNFALNMGFAIMVIVAALCYAVNVNVVKTYLHGIDAVTITVMAFFTVGPIAAAYLLLFTGIGNDLLTNPASLTGLAYVSILAVMGTGLALMLYNRLIQITGAVFASSVTYFIPVVALLWGIFDGEMFGAGFLWWIALVIAGVLLVNTSSLHKGVFSRLYSAVVKNSQ